MEQTIEERVKEILATRLGLDEGNLKLTDRLLHELGADEMDLEDVVMDLEEAFVTDISDEEVEKLLTVGDIVNWLTENAE